MGSCALMMQQFMTGRGTRSLMASHAVPDSTVSGQIWPPLALGSFKLYRHGLDQGPGSV